MSECMLKMCALLYYLCLTYALFHFFFPFNRTPTPVLYSFSNWESRGIVLCFPEPSVAVGTCAGSHLLAYSVVGRRTAQAI